MQKMITANVDKSVEIREDEKNMVHVRLTKREHIPNEKRYKDIINIVCYSVLDFNRMVKDRFFEKGLFTKYEIVHDPRRKDEIEAVNSDKSEKEDKKMFAGRSVQSIKDLYTARLKKKPNHLAKPETLVKELYKTVCGLDAPEDPNWELILDNIDKTPLTE